MDDRDVSALRVGYAELSISGPEFVLCPPAQPIAQVQESLGKYIQRVSLQGNFAQRSPGPLPVTGGASENGQ